MPRRMSCSLTIDAVRERRKTVTRRHVDTWRNLKPGDRLTLIEKGMGLAKGEKQVELAEAVVVDVREEPLGQLVADIAYGVRELGREGIAAMYPSWGPADFVRFWAGSHGYGSALHDWPAGTPAPHWVRSIRCRRIEWRYLDEEEGQIDGAPSRVAHAGRPAGSGTEGSEPSARADDRPDRAPSIAALEAEHEEEWGPLHPLADQFIAPSWTCCGWCICGAALPPMQRWIDAGRDWQRIECVKCGRGYVDEEEFIAIYDDGLDEEAPDAR